MNENKKFNEAKYFLSQMVNSIKDSEVFEYNLSAFLSASRSILQYSYEEVIINGSQKWYDDFVGKSSFIKYFKDKRDTNIHYVPIKTLHRHEFSNVVSVPLTFNIKIINKNEDLKDSVTNENKIERFNKSENKTRIIFKDWSGEEDVTELCTKYLQVLLLFLEEGISKKYITG